MSVNGGPDPAATSEPLARHQPGTDPGDSRLPLSPEHIARLQKSGWAHQTMLALGVRTLSDPGHIAAVLGRDVSWAKQLGDCLEFPYPGVPGYAVLRPNNPCHRYAFTEFGDGPSCANAPAQQPKDGRRVEKYETPRGTRPHIYDPRIICTPDSAMSGRHYVTEGEKKAALMCQLGLPTLAVPGALALFLADTRQGAHLPRADHRILDDEFGRHVQPGQEWCIVFDAPDIEGANPVVVRAAIVLARTTIEVGGTALIAYIPPSNDGGKRGVDDYFMDLPPRDRDRQGLGVVVQSARPLPPVDAVEWLVHESYQHDWDTSRMALETRRIAVMARFWWEYNPTALRAWVREAANRLGVERADLWVCSEGM